MITLAVMAVGISFALILHDVKQVRDGSKPTTSAMLGVFLSLCNAPAVAARHLRHGRWPR